MLRNTQGSSRSFFAYPQLFLFSVVLFIGIVQADPAVENRAKTADIYDKTTISASPPLNLFNSFQTAEIVRLVGPILKGIISLFYQLAYVSLSKTPLEQTLLSDILNVSQKNNTRDGICGTLMYHDQLFFQVLEGERTRIKNCYVRILNDQRHSGISLQWEGETETRAFTSWPMGYAGPDEIGLHCGRQLASLVDLHSGKDANQNRNNVALQLARVMFRRMGA